MKLNKEIINMIKNFYVRLRIALRNLLDSIYLFFSQNKKKKKLFFNIFFKN